MTAASREHIVSEIRRTAIEGRALGRSRFAEATGIRENDWSGRYWTRWSDAVREAGFEPNTLQGRYDDSLVFQKLAAEVRRLGRMPTHAELRLRRHEDLDFPSAGVFAKFGRKRELAAKLAAYCKEQGDCADILEALSPLMGEEQSSEIEEVGEIQFAVVYLLKSGRHYKLGRTNSLGRREYELAIQLPQKPTRIHAIKTDDPEGIEAYWHGRFADRRRNGEWFELTAADVRAFRRRKFM